MKCLDKKRIKLKGGETLALNERIMLSLVSTEVGKPCPIVSETTSVELFAVSSDYILFCFIIFLLLPLIMQLMF